MPDQTLIERLAAAKEGSRELSDEVLLACGWHVKSDRTELRSSDGKVWVPLIRYNLPDPTTSIDNARRWVVPDGAFFGVEGPQSDGQFTGVASTAVMCYARAATPALALSIAGLKARDLDTT